MGCNCGKTPPLGATPPKQSSAESAETGTSAGTAKLQSFQLEVDSGRTLTFGSRLEAEAARIRMGGRLVLP